ncbi:hypothetical protein WAI453_012022 [Rhynchosporium graminicola]
MKCSHTEPGFRFYESEDYLVEVHLKKARVEEIGRAVLRREKERERETRLADLRPFQALVVEIHGERIDHDQMYHKRSERESQPSQIIQTLRNHQCNFPVPKDIQNQKQKYEAIRHPQGAK